MPIAVVAVGIALVIGLVNRRRAFGLLLLLVSIPLVDLICAPLFDQLPTWLLLAVGGVFVLQVARTLLEFLLGPHAAGHVLGTSVIGFARLAGRLSMVPLRLIALLLRLAFRGRQTR